MNYIKEIKETIDKYIERSQQSVLKGVLLNELIVKLRSLKIKGNVDEILKLKIEKLQKEPNTVWTDQHGFAIGGKSILINWKILIDELYSTIPNFEQNTNIALKPEYFSPNSKVKIFEKLKTLFPVAKNTIKVYDNYINSEILKLIANIEQKIVIQILTKDQSITEKFKKQVVAFKVLYEIDIEIRKSDNSHDRFYIIDENVFTLGASTKGGSINKATNFAPLEKSQGEKVINDFDDWWGKGTALSFLG